MHSRGEHLGLWGPESKVLPGGFRERMLLPITPLGTKTAALAAAPFNRGPLPAAKHLQSEIY